MPKASANGIELEYESLGDEGAPPIVMIMGLGSQMIVWPDELCALIVERGYRVIRYDNRDVGLSTKPTAQYTLDDMADDCAGLLDSLGIARAHIVGASMGGYIAQLMATRHPTRLRSLCIMMSSTGSREVGGADPDILPMIMTPSPADREGHVVARMKIARRLASPAYPFPEERIRSVYGRAYDRCYFPLGSQRQLAAVMTSYDRTEALGRVDAPTLVIHGSADAIVHVDGAQAIARAIPGAELLVFEGMGHDLPAALWPAMADAISANARRYDARAQLT